MSKNIVAIYTELMDLKRELERIPSADVRMVTGTLAFGGGPRYAPVNDVRDTLNEAWKHLNEAEKLLADMEVAP